jgi:hypothetical protein
MSISSRKVFIFKEPNYPAAVRLILQCVHRRASNASGSSVYEAPNAFTLIPATFTWAMVTASHRLNPHQVSRMHRRLF